MINFISSLFSTKPYGVGLALSGGGAKGFSHLGAMKALLAKGVVPDVVAGVSAGSIVGALYCDGYSPDEISAMFSHLSYSDLMKMTLPKRSFFSMEPFMKVLKEKLRTRYIEDLPLPLIVVATDLDRATVKEFRSGSIVDAVLASCSVPVIFPPVMIDGHHYMDGGVLKNFPCSTLRKDCKTLVGINVLPFNASESELTIRNIAIRSFKMMANNNSIEDKKLCDLLIEVEDTEYYKFYDISRQEELIQVGFEAASICIDRFISKKRSRF